MTIQDHLTNDENILAENREGWGWPWHWYPAIYYATNKRVIKYKQKLFFGGEELSDLPYSNITSIDFYSRRFILKGIVILLIAYGLYVLITKLLIQLLSIPIISNIDELVGGLISLIINFIVNNELIFMILPVIIGIIGIFLIVHKDAHYVFLSPLSEKEAKKWDKIPHQNTETATEFIKIVRNHLK
jgi:hypothetical protein